MCVGILSIAETELSGGELGRTAPEMVFDVTRRAIEGSGLARGEIDFTISGSSDMLEGRSFNFAYALEAMGAHPATEECHVEMDGAWAAYYAWIKILSGQARSALVIAWGKCSEGSLHHVLNTQLDPFFLAPLGLDHVTSAALQADAFLARTGLDASALDRIAARSREHASRNRAVARSLVTKPREGALATPLLARHASPPTDGACALVMARDDIARSVCDRPAWIRGADHRTESGAIGHRELDRIPSAAIALHRARELAGWQDAPPHVDVAELAASFAHQEAMLEEALALGEGTAINPSGGALAADPMMATGLVRLAECALQVTGRAGDHQVHGARRGLAHAAQGHALQQNLVWLLEGDA